jgi:hypothetical protein
MFFGLVKLYQNKEVFSLFLHKFNNFVDNVSKFFQKVPKLKNKIVVLQLM